MYNTRLDFMSHRRLAVGLSLLLIVASLVLVGIRGLNFGLDFTGGTLIEVAFQDGVTADTVRGVLAKGDLGEVTVQQLGSEHDLLVRIPVHPTLSESQVSAELLSRLASGQLPPAEIRRTEFIGPSVGEDLRDAGGIALLGAFGGIGLYVAWRFSGKFATASIVALVHDVVLTVGMFSLFQWSVDLSTVAALLTVIGYSLNDTIVICDRIRENLRQLRRESLTEVINLSLNQTLERTLIMSVTTLAVLLAMVFFGGDQLRGFAMALTIGVVVGTYSSIYVAAAYLIFARLSREDILLPTPETGADKSGDGAP
ncbi:MAG: protein translocase subunit SecF, partial [Parahaliea sp.]